MFWQEGGNVLRYRAQGAQRASNLGGGTATTAVHDAVRVAIRPVPDLRAFSVRAVAAMLVLAIVAAVGMSVVVTPAVRAGSAAAGMKAVIIVGPASSSTQEYLDEGEKIARQAEAVGMDVRRIFTPRATWPRVKANIQGANLVVYLGHGNGWPSNMGPFRGESKDGFGLNPCEDCGTSSPTKYYGEDFIREKVQLAPKAVVFLHRLCYASGNAESGMPPVFNKELATERASNFASGFLDAGAAAVFALGWRQKLNLPQQLATTDKTMDDIFKTRGSDGDWYDGFQGWDDYHRESTRNRGARVHLDPHKRYGHLRAVTGNLEVTAAEWRGETPPPDEVPPTLKVKGTGTTDDPTAAAADETLAFSPDGDGVADRMLVRRTLSEPAYVDLEVRDRDGTTVRTVEKFGEQGTGESFWDGRNQDGKVVADGRYTLRLTPRDRAGNVGETATVDVKVLTSLRRLKASAPAIHVNDRDELADSVTLSSVLREEASVTWQIRQGDRVIRSRFADEALPAGDLTWRWDGKDDHGDLVPNGTYTAFLSARTGLGTLRYQVPVQVGNWTIRLSDRVVTRKQEVQVIAKSLEPLEAGARLEIDQPGLDPRSVAMRLKDKHTLVVTFTVAKGGDTGRIWLHVVASDRNGQEETGPASLRLR